MIEVFRTEIIEAEKSRIDLLKWKLFIVATLFAVGSEKFNPGIIDASLALALIPIVATYVDLLCVHLKLRILVISEFFQNYPPNSDIPHADINYFIAYEKFCEKKRNIFVFETVAQTGSTLILSAIIIFLGGWNQHYNCNIIYSGIFGVAATIILFICYKCRINELTGKFNKCDKFDFTR